MEYAAYMLTRAEVGADGKTAYERSRGKMAKLPGVEFGEGVMWKRRREGGPLGKLTSMWDDGIFLGVKGSTGEMIVGDEKGVWRTRTIRRKPEGERWSRENMERIGGVPWRMTKEAEGDGEDLKNEVTIMDKEYRERAKMEESEPVPRKVYISKDDLEVHGYTVGCSGCKSALRGTTRQAHTEGCRKRLEKELEGTEKATRAKKKVGEYVDKKMGEEEEVRSARSEAKKIHMGEGRGAAEKDKEMKMDEGRGLDEEVHKNETRKDEEKKRKTELEEVDVAKKAKVEEEETRKRAAEDEVD